MCLGTKPGRSGTTISACYISLARSVTLVTAAVRRGAFLAPDEEFRTVYATIDLRTTRMINVSFSPDAGTSCGPVSVCLSVTSRSAIETAERIGLVIRKFGFLQNKATSRWNFSPNSGLRKFLHGISIVETCYQLRRRKVDADSVINWSVVGQLS